MNGWLNTKGVSAQVYQPKFYQPKAPSRQSLPPAVPGTHDRTDTDRPGHGSAKRRFCATAIWVPFGAGTLDLDIWDDLYE